MTFRERNAISPPPTTFNGFALPRITSQVIIPAIVSPLISRSKGDHREKLAVYVRWNTELSVLCEVWVFSPIVTLVLSVSVDSSSQYLCKWYVYTVADSFVCDGD